MRTPVLRPPLLLATLCLAAAGCAGRAGLAIPPSARPFIAHGGGEIAGLSQTNSGEAFKKAYDACFRLLEADLIWSSDSELLLAHDNGPTFTELFHAQAGTPSLREFRAFKMSGGLTQWTFADLAAWAADKPDAYIITDVKGNNLEALKRIARDYPALKGRILPEIFRAAEFDYWTARDLGFGGVILSLYSTDASDEKVLKFAHTVDLFAVTMPVERAAAGDLARKLGEAGVFVYAHTVNDRAEFDALKARGVRGIYSDKLTPPCPPEPAGRAGAPSLKPV